MMYADNYDSYVTAEIRELEARVGWFSELGNRTTYILRQIRIIETVWYRENEHFRVRKMRDQSYM